MKRLPATPLFSTSGVSTRPFKAILEATDIRADDLGTIVALTQEKWRKPTLLAAQITDEQEHLSKELLPHFRNLQLVGVKPLEPRKYQWTALLGATYVAVHKRLKRAVDAWKREDAKWTNTVLLGSHRSRFNTSANNKENDDVLSKVVDGGLPFDPDWKVPPTFPNTEGGIMDLVRKQVGRAFPWDRQREYLLTAPNKADDKPAGTKETLRFFADELDPQGANLLLISSQPHMLRQQIEAQKILGHRFDRIDITGYDLPAEVTVTQTPDELAKLVFDITQD